MRKRTFCANEANKYIFPTWQQPSCEEVEDGKGYGSQSNEARPVDALLVVHHVNVDAVQTLAQSLALHDWQVLSLLAPPGLHRAGF